MAWCPQMDWCPQIGETYLLLDQAKDKYLLWAVIENDFKCGSTTLQVVEDGPDKDKTKIVSTSWIKKQPEFGMVIELAGEIVIENGKQHVKPALENAQAKTL